MRKIKFVTGQYYHVYNRGVDKRKIFIDKGDHYRFIHDLYEFNHEDATIHLDRRLNGRCLASTNNDRKRRRRLVDIVCFCLMPNHFHFILKQIKEHGITRFMQKLGTGYTMYFNKRNERTGSLFENTFKAILIEEDSYLMHLSRYMHLNPVELMGYSLKDEAKYNNFNWKEINEFLENYKWSSYRDYVGKRNFPSVINEDVITDYFESPEDYKKFVAEYVQMDRPYIKDLVIDE